MKPKCIHCNMRTRQKFKRNLCLRCYRDLAIRNLYPSYQNHAPPKETLADLDAMEAEARKNLPAWWFKDAVVPENPPMGNIRVVRTIRRRNGKIVV